MAAETVVHIGENSPEEVAYKLLRHVAWAENKPMHTVGAVPGGAADRKWILDAYAECLRTVRDPFGHPNR